MRRPAFIPLFALAVVAALLVQPVAAGTIGFFGFEDEGSGDVTGWVSPSDSTIEAIPEGSPDEDGWSGLITFGASCEGPYLDVGSLTPDVLSFFLRPEGDTSDPAGLGFVVTGSAADGYPEIIHISYHDGWLWAPNVTDPHPEPLAEVWEEWMLIQLHFDWDAEALDISVWGEVFQTAVPFAESADDVGRLVASGCDAADQSIGIDGIRFGALHTLSGSVLFEGEPLIGVEVFAQTESGPRFTCTNDLGEFAFEGVDSAEMVATGPAVSDTGCTNPMFVANPDANPENFRLLLTATAQGLELDSDVTLDPIHVEELPKPPRQLADADDPVLDPLREALVACYSGFPEIVWGNLDGYAEGLGEFESQDPSDGKKKGQGKDPWALTPADADAYRTYAHDLWAVGLGICPTAEIDVLVHEFPLMNEFMEEFNERFQLQNPGVAVGMTVVPAGDLEEVAGQLLAEGSVDVVDIFGFANAAQPYMSAVEPQPWQTLIDQDLLLDLTGYGFVGNYDPASIADACSYDGRIYCVNLGRVLYSGMFVNETLLDAHHLAVPATWEGLVEVCDTLTGAGHTCMTVGGADWWPVYVGSYGILGSFYPDQAALVEGLWTGTIRWDDDRSVEMFRRFQKYATDMLEPEVVNLGQDAALERFLGGSVGFSPTGTWQAPTLEDAAPAFDWTYVPFPGSSDAADNQYLFGKYDQGWGIAADSPNQETALDYVAAFSEPENYQAFVDAVGFIPTQPTATIDSQLGEIIAPYLEDERVLVGFEQHWVGPSCAGEFANGSLAASWFAPFGEWTDHMALAEQAQADLDACGPNFRANAQVDYIEGWNFE
ncbi:MAG: extracellular solute-binding protein, partial [Acidimicrobiia bacterium]